ncbi:uncharacterized protein [Pseudorasbora parva]|uniref:uncharacterized protein n=1 Tax=Pseudorasbora parva TaxID=51549 RepID=UPI00351EC3F3
MSARLRVILQEEIRKLSLPSGIPQTVEELKHIVQETFAIEQDFNLQFQDQDFDGQFFTLLGTDEIKDKHTIKVVLAEPVITLTFQDSSNVQENIDSICTEFLEDVVSCSTASSNATILSFPGSTSSLRSVPWPAQFEIPTFSLDTELFLQAANEAYRKDGTLLCNPAVKSNILDKLAESIFVHTAYPSMAQREQVAEALVTKHPCLRDPVSSNGLYSWHNSLKYKLGNYRAKVKHLGLPELNVNCLKRNSAADKTESKNLKKAKKSEVNYLPPHPQGETDASLEKERVELLYEYKKRDNNRVINEKMAKTFSLRRKDVIQKPPVIDLNARWPALFEFSQIEEEFRRITLKPLQSTFLGKLDQYTPKLLSLYRRKGGAVGKKLDETLDILNEDNSIESRRETVIRGLILYLSEKTEELIKDYPVCAVDGAATIEEDLTSFVLKIFVVSKDKDGGLEKKAGIAIEGAEVLFGIPNVAHACIYLMGLIYAIELSYPKQLKYTFEVFQKIFLELEDVNKKMSSKVHDLMVCLLA